MHNEMFRGGREEVKKSRRHGAIHTIDNQSSTGPKYHVVLTSSLKSGINCCGRGSKRQIQIIRYNHKQSARLAAVQNEGDIGKFRMREIRG